MNKQNGRAKFNNFQILLDSRCSSKSLTGGLITEINTKEDDVIQWHTQSGGITTNIKVKMEFTLPELSAM